MALDWPVLWKYEPEIIEGLWITLRVSSWSILFSTILGLAVGCLRIMPIFFLAKILDLYVEILRNIPAVVKLFLIHFVLGFDAFMAGAISLSLHQSAYIPDLISARLRSLPGGDRKRVV